MTSADEDFGSHRRRGDGRRGPAHAKTSPRWPDAGTGPFAAQGTFAAAPPGGGDPRFGPQDPRWPDAGPPAYQEAGPSAYQADDTTRPSTPGGPSSPAAISPSTREWIPQPGYQAEHPGWSGQPAYPGRVPRLDRAARLPARVPRLDRTARTAYPGWTGQPAYQPEYPGQAGPYGQHALHPDHPSWPEAPVCALARRRGAGDRSPARRRRPCRNGCDRPTPRSPISRPAPTSLPICSLRAGISRCTGTWTWLRSCRRPSPTWPTGRSQTSRTRSPPASRSGTPEHRSWPTGSSKTPTSRPPRSPARRAARRRARWQTRSRRPPSSYGGPASRPR